MIYWIFILVFVILLFSLPLTLSFSVTVMLVIFLSLRSKLIFIYALTDFTLSNLFSFIFTKYSIYGFR